MTYDEMLIEADNSGFITKELPLQSTDGRCKGKRIAIRKDIDTQKKKADVLAEEMAHYYTGVGDIIDQDTIESRKQERKARLLCYRMRLPLLDIVAAYKAHCRDIYEMSEYLDVSEDTIRDALEYYRQIYGVSTIVGDYVIQFEPYLRVGTYIRFD